MFANAMSGSATRMTGRPFTGTDAGTTAADALLVCHAARCFSVSTKVMSPGCASASVRALVMASSGSPSTSPDTHSPSCRTVTFTVWSFRPRGPESSVARSWRKLANRRGRDKPNRPREQS